MAQKTVLGVGPSVEIEDNPRAVDFDVGDDHTGARLGGKPLADHHVQVVCSGRIQFAVGRQGEAFVTARKGAHGKALLRLQGADEQEARLGVQLRFGQFYMGGLDLRILPVDRPGGRNWALAAGIDGDDLG